MSVNYSSGLSPYDNKGVCGLPEIFDDASTVEEKVEILKHWIMSSKNIVFHCGAGISTSCGIPDFRGPKGVWTIEENKGKKRKREPEEDKTTNNDKAISFDQSLPSYTHRALVELTEKNFIHHIVSQNVDGLFLKAGIKRRFISELHGNFYLDECSSCATRYLRTAASQNMGLKLTNRRCPRPVRSCRGFLRDTILDWEDNLPELELKSAQEYSQKADLSICLGTSLQIIPAAQLPFLCKKRKSNPGKSVIINLQPTKYDKKADLVIHDYVDNVMVLLCKKLNLQVPDYRSEKDLTLFDQSQVSVWI